MTKVRFKSRDKAALEDVIHFLILDKVDFIRKDGKHFRRSLIYADMFVPKAARIALAAKVKLDISSADATNWRKMVQEDWDTYM